MGVTRCSTLDLYYLFFRLSFSPNARIMYRFALALAVAVLVAAPVLSMPFSKCVTPNTVDTVDLASYMGTWYEIADNANFRKAHEEGLICTRANYTLNSDGTVKVNNTGYKVGASGALERSSAIGHAKQDKGGKLEVSFFKNFYGPYWIIDLWGEAGKPAEGYEVSVVYSCSSVLGFSSTDLWVLSRTPQLPKGLTLERIREIVEKQGVVWGDLNMSLTNQTCSF